mgnify:CR=1 FL=1
MNIIKGLITFLFAAASFYLAEIVERGLTSDHVDVLLAKPSIIRWVTGGTVQEVFTFTWFSPIVQIIAIIFAFWGIYVMSNG